VLPIDGAVCRIRKILRQIVDAVCRNGEILRQIVVAACRSLAVAQVLDDAACRIVGSAWRRATSCSDRAAISTCRSTR
jgi:hypothetical protein